MGIATAIATPSGTRLRLARRRRCAALLDALDHGIQALLVDLRAEVFAEALHVADALDDDVPRLPAVRRLAWHVVLGNARAIAALDLGAHGGVLSFRVDLRRQYLHAIACEFDQRVTVVLQQRLVERI